MLFPHYVHIIHNNEKVYLDKCIIMKVCKMMHCKERGEGGIMCYYVFCVQVKGDYVLLCVLCTSEGGLCVIMCFVYR